MARMFSNKTQIMFLRKEKTEIEQIEKRIREFRAILKELKEDSIKSICKQELEKQEKKLEELND